VGEGELRGELEEQARRLGVADAVRFHGQRGHRDVAELMRQADLFVLPSLFENLPCVLLEAIASGLPCVATAVGGVAEVLDDETGVLCQPRDPASLATAISLASDRREHFDPAAMAEQAHARFGFQAIEREWTGLYRELASRRGSTSRVSVRRTASGR
jgi:glycosyltransferase involved in cell wall biosynthesis